MSGFTTRPVIYGRKGMVTAGHYLAAHAGMRMLEAGGTATEAIAHLGIKPVDAGALVEVVRRAIAANPAAVAEYKKGKAAAANSFIGPIRRETKANADVVRKLILEELEKA